MLELASIIVLGIFAQWVAWRTRVPAILPLILVGLLVGPVPEWIFGEKFIEPVFEYVRDASGNVIINSDGNPADNGGLFNNNILFYFVSLSIGIILFEGGMTLKLKEVRDTGTAIGRLVTIGSLVTFIGAGLASVFILDVSYQIGFLFAGLIIVTGPTVIAPILRNIPLNRNVATVLKWESILIDPLGALVAVLVFDFIISGHSGGAFTIEALREFVEIICVGFTFGIGGALGLYMLLKRDLIPHYLLNVVSLALVLGVFACSDLMVKESGLLTVVVMGMLLANLKVPHFREILYFKESLTVLLISILFILLSANIDAKSLISVFELKYLLIFLVVLVLRPIGVLLSTINSGLSFREKFFIAWVGPRGIVAAGIASLFGLKLVENGVEDAEIITPLVFLIVMGTVLLNATTARIMARVLNVVQQSSDGVLIVGANSGAMLVAKFLQAEGRHVVLIDRSADQIEQAREEGLEAIEGDVFSDEWEENFDLLDMGYLLALTPSASVNDYVCQRYQPVFGENGTFRLISQQEIGQDTELSEEVVFDSKTDFINFLETARDYPTIHKKVLQSKDDLQAVCNQFCRNTIPLFISKNGTYHFIKAKGCDIDIEVGDELVYMGKEIGNPDLVAPQLATDNV